MNELVEVEPGVCLAVQDLGHGRPVVLIAGFGLLNVADARWAHAVGVLCLLAFMLIGFRAVIFAALTDGVDELH